MDAITFPPAPTNEPNLTYAPGSPERETLVAELARLEKKQQSFRAVIGGKRRNGGGAEMKVVQPHDHAHVLGTLKNSTAKDAEAAVKAANDAAPAWQAMPFDERCAIILKAADLLAGPWRQTLNAATMLGQSKTAFQAEIDAACELIDFWRFNVHYAKQILTDQPIANSPGIWNRTDHRPLEGFVYAITPFNFTAIAGNLPTAPALMGNTVIWKPSPTQQLAASLTMELLEEAGMPPGVINMLPGDGLDVSKVALTHRDLAGIHFTGSTPTFHRLWKSVGENIDGYRSYPRIVGETGGKDFIVAHPSADPDVLRVGDDPRCLRVPGPEVLGRLAGLRRRSRCGRRSRTSSSPTPRRSPMGDVTDFTNFMGAVIDDRAFAKHKAAIARAKRQKHLTVIAGGQTDDSVGYFVRPTIIESTDPTDQMFADEYFGPILAVHVYDDARFEKVVEQMESFAPYALTGAIIAQDRAAIAWARKTLRFAAGNFYINDKPTGAVVGPAALRWRSRVGHQRQGRRCGQPAALDLAAVDQGDLRAPEGPPLPAPGLTSGHSSAWGRMGACSPPSSRSARCGTWGPCTPTSRRSRCCWRSGPSWCSGW